MTPSGLSIGIILKIYISLNNLAVILLLNKKSRTPTEEVDMDHILSSSMRIPVNPVLSPDGGEIEKMAEHHGAKCLKTIIY